MSQKVWILEGFVSRQFMEEQLQKYESTRYLAETDAEKRGWDNVCGLYRDKIKEYPDGFWCGVEGKDSFSVLLPRAIDAVKRYGTHYYADFRIVLASIPDDREYWLPYTDYEVSEDATRLLFHYLETEGCDRCD